MEDVRERQACRGCGQTTLATVLDLGELAISRFPTSAEQHARLTAPLDLCRCRRCGLVQMRHTVAPELLFTEYWYRSGVNETMRAELRSIVEQAHQYAPVRVDDLVVDIGANDGTLLATYDALGLRRPYRIAVEPAANLQELAKRHADLVYQEFFPGDGSLVRLGEGEARHVFSIACFYDLDDPHAFVEAVRRLLHPSGVWIVQFQDLHQMLQATAFDNLCHEHLVHYSLGTFSEVIALHGLRVIHAEQRRINGGSLRIVVQRIDGPHEPDTTVQPLRNLEDNTDWGLIQFADRTHRLRDQIRATVACSPKPVDLYGASTKANTLLQVCGLGPRQIRNAWERSPEKYGRQTVTGIPITSEEVGRAVPPPMLLVGIWQFRTAVIQREADYLRRGGALLFPLPAPEIIWGDR